jgi:hypothetical protein
VNRPQAWPCCFKHNTTSCEGCNSAVLTRSHTVCWWPEHSADTGLTNPGGGVINCPNLGI